MSRARNMRRRKMKTATKKLFKLEVPTYPIVKLGVDLDADEVEQLKRYINAAYEVFNDDFEAMTDSEAEMFSVMLQLAKHAWDNHAAHLTGEAGLRMAIDKLNERELQVFMGIMNAADRTLN